MGVSRQTASKWLSRARLARSTPPADVERVLEARRSMLLAPLAPAFVARALAFFGAWASGSSA